MESILNVFKWPTYITKKILYGITKEFSKEFHNEIRDIIKSEINSSWCSPDPTDIWHYDFEPFELKGSNNVREIPQFLISSFELKEEVSNYNITDTWYKVNNIARKDRQAKTKNLRDNLSQLGKDYYLAIDRIPKAILSICEETLGNLLASRKNSVKILLTAPFYKSRKSELQIGLIGKLVMMYNVVLGMIFLKIINLQRISKTLASAAVNCSGSRDDRIKFFRYLNRISKSLINGHNEKYIIPSFGHLLGEKVYQKLSDEFRELKNIRTKAAPIYIEYLLSQYASFDIVPSHISFGQDGKLRTPLPNPKLFLQKQELTDYENEVLNREHDSQGPIKESAVFIHLMQWMKENDFLPGKERKIYKYIQERFEQDIGRCTLRTICDKLKIIAKVDTKPKMEKYLWSLYHRLQKPSERSGKD